MLANAWMYLAYSMKDILKYVEDVLELLVLEEANWSLSILTSMFMAISLYKIEIRKKEVLIIR